MLALDGQMAPDAEPTAEDQKLRIKDGRLWLRLELCALRAARMREPRPGVRIGSGSMHVRFRAGDGPPARGITLRFAHFHATTPGMRFRAMAITARDRSSAQQRGRVGVKRNGAGQEDNSQPEQSPDGEKK